MVECGEWGCTGGMVRHKARRVSMVRRWLTALGICALSYKQCVYRCRGKKQLKAKLKILQSVRKTNGARFQGRQRKMRSKTWVKSLVLTRRKETSSSKAREKQLKVVLSKDKIMGRGTMLGKSISISQDFLTWGDRAIFWERKVATVENNCWGKWKGGPAQV